MDFFFRLFRLFYRGLVKVWCCALKFCGIGCVASLQYTTNVKDQKA